eukprot:COSAG02_NODE_774_length_17325_cov_322.794381_7_plen_227_part_00
MGGGDSSDNDLDCRHAALRQRHEVTELIGWWVSITPLSIPQCLASNALPLGAGALMWVIVRSTVSALATTWLLLLDTATSTGCTWRESASYDLLGATCEHYVSSHARGIEQVAAAYTATLLQTERSPLNASSSVRFVEDDCPIELVVQAVHIDCLDRGADLASAAGDPAQANEWREMANHAWANAEAMWPDAQLGCYAHSCDCSEAKVVGYLLHGASNPEARSDPL